LVADHLGVPAARSRSSDLVRRFHERFVMIRGG
jgi:hypothetical protein